MADPPVRPVHPWGRFIPPSLVSDHTCAVNSLTLMYETFHTGKNVLSFRYGKIKPFVSCQPTRAYLPVPNSYGPTPAQLAHCLRMFRSTVGRTNRSNGGWAPLVCLHWSDSCRDHRFMGYDTHPEARGNHASDLSLFACHHLRSLALYNRNNVCSCCPVGTHQ